MRREGGAGCPHCRPASGTTLQTTVAVVLLGLAAAGCPDDTTTSPQPAYGVTITETADTGTPSE